MKILVKLRNLLGIACMIVIGFIAFNSFTSNNKVAIHETQDSSVMVTIDSQTSDNELDEIKDMLKENGIIAKFNNIKRNNKGLITGINIELKDNNGNSATSQISSSNPIANISFGKKNGALYITQGKGSLGNFAFFADDMNFNFDQDSIMHLYFGKLDSLELGNMFNFDNHTFSFNGKSMDIDELVEQMQNSFKVDEDENGNKRIIIQKGAGNHFFFSDESDGKPHQKFRFVDNPNTEKLIVIDGKESDFKTLDGLATDDKLDNVDILQPNTAMSIYGKKAKDGAIIATTKK